MSVYLITWHATDGNDATVYDSIVGARNENAALDKLESSWLSEWPDAESDGDSGLYFSCDCEDADSCDGHGGTVVREVQKFRSYADAEKNTASYHSTWTVN